MSDDEAARAVGAALRERIELHYRYRSDEINTGATAPRLAAEVFVNAAFGLLSGADLAVKDSGLWLGELTQLALHCAHQLDPSWDLSESTVWHFGSHSKRRVM